MLPLMVSLSVGRVLAAETVTMTTGMTQLRALLHWLTGLVRDVTPALP